MIKEGLYVGIDLGGTAIKMGIVNNSGRLLHLIERATPVKEGYAKTIDLFNEMINQLITESNGSWKSIKGIGIGLPGFVDVRNGKVMEASNLNWKTIDIKKSLQSKWNIPVQIENDANVAALGEMWVGAGKGFSHILCVTIGTGIGGGIIINRKIYRGANGIAGEIGHLIVRHEYGRDCICGQKGCLETEVSASAIVANAKKEMEKLPKLPDVWKKNGEVTARTIILLAKEGDPVCKKIIAKTANLLGLTLSQICYVLNPERIIIGGGVSYAGELLLNPLIAAFKANAYQQLTEHTSIVQANLGNKAGVIGAALLVKRHVTKVKYNLVKGLSK